MAGNNSTVDGMGFEEANQASFTDVISGTNVYASSTMQCEDLVANDTVSDSDGELKATSIGSPSAYGASIQAGAGTLGAGSLVAITYGHKFVGLPRVVVNYSSSTPDVGAICGSNIGSVGFVAVGDTASIDFDWIAVGL